MKATTILKTFILCPHCGDGETLVSHLEIGQQFGPWSCDDCGKSYAGVRTETGADLELRDKFKLPITVTLRYIHDPKLILKIEAWEYDFNFKETDSERADHHRYHYDEGTCPTNYLHIVDKIIFDGDDDPHGLFEFVSSEPRMLAAARK